MTVRADSHPRWCSRETLAAVGYAPLFSVPVGVGVTVMMTRVAPGRPTDPLVVGPGLVPAVVAFAPVVAAATTGENAAQLERCSSPSEAL